MKPTVFIMRGIPGSGKSTEAREIASIRADAGPAVICSTDDFFMEQGVYKWNPKKLRVNHQKNFEKFCTALDDEIPTVIVDNTNVQEQHWLPYAQEARSKGYRVEIHTIMCDPETSAKRNTHNVPLEACRRMYDALGNGQLSDKARRYVHSVWQKS